MINLDFIKREKMYILMLVFILVLNLIQSLHVEKRDYSEKKVMSNMTFKEIGVTEKKIKGFFESNKVSSRFFRYSIISRTSCDVVIIGSNISPSINNHKNTFTLYIETMISQI